MRLNLSLSLNTIMLIVAGVLILAVVVILIFWRRPRKLKNEYFVANWKELQASLREKTNWPKALIEADQLLNKALKKRKLKGKSMGEKMVSGQRLFTNNDGLWFAHNMAKKVKSSKEDVKLKESEVKTALMGYIQALKDIGALPKGDHKDDK